MSGRYELLVFDWDGTLFDSVGRIVSCLQRAALASGVKAPDEAAARSVIGLGLHEAMEVLYPGYPSELASRMSMHYREFYNEAGLSDVGLFPGVGEMLSGLRDEGYKLAVATGKTRSGLDHALRQTGMEGFFHASRCADETISKPHPLMMFELMEELGVGPARTLMVGDSTHDLHMAGRAGVAAVAVGCGANTLAELAGLGPLACLGQTADLSDFLASR